MKTKFISINSSDGNWLYFIIDDRLYLVDLTNKLSQLISLVKSL